MPREPISPQFYGMLRQQLGSIGHRREFRLVHHALPLAHQ
jgi:hypothetical protein